MGAAPPPAPGAAKRSPTKGSPRVPAARLFAFASTWDRVSILIGLLCATGQGAIFPLFTLIFADLLDALNSPGSLTATVNTYSSYFLIIAIVAALGAAVATTLPMLASERQMSRVRTAYMRALLRQDVGHVDVSTLAGEVSSRLAEDTILWGGGIGEKLTGAARDITGFVAGLAVGFSKSWQLTLVIFSITPLLAVIIGFLAVSVRSMEKRSADAYAKAGDAATEAFSLIRSVVAYGGEELEVKKYDGFLGDAELAGRRKGWTMGAAVGSMFGLLYVLYGVAMVAGARFVLTSREENPLCRFNPLLPGCFSGGDVIATFMAVLIGAFSLGGAGPNIAAFGSAQAAAHGIFAVLDRVPPVDSAESGGQTPGPVIRGKIEFRSVTFAYPSRPSEVILSNFSLVIAPGTMVALVGESGSGKSTLIALLERFYDPQEGVILVDDIPLREWNVKHLRDCLGLVSQDPILFGVSVRENIEYGAVQGATVSMEEVVSAAKAANAHGFISTLPLGYDTVVGTSVASAQLSGGQRQRICIARAVVRNPPILLLDEATSALDTQSERVVQASIDALLAQSRAPSSPTSPTPTHGRTSLVIAHRLSTITGADRIVVMRKGVVVEDGTHAALMAQAEGVYRHLRSLQDMGGAVSTGGKAADAAASTAAPLLPASDAVPEGGSEVEDGQAATAVHVNPMHGKAAPASSSSSKKAAGAGLGAVDVDEDEPLTKPKGPVDTWRVWRLQKPDWPWLVLALCGSVVSGCIQPVFAIIYSNMISVFFLPDDAELKRRSEEYVVYFVAIAVVFFTATTLRIGSFIYVGERLTRRLRTQTYRALLRQPMAFYDDPKNSTGRLNTRLSSDAALVRGGTGESVGMRIQTYAAITAAGVIAFVASWRLALVMLAVMPLLVVGGQMQTTAFKGYSMGEAKALEESGHIATEAMMAFRTVTAFNLQDHVVTTFAKTLVAPQAAGFAKAKIAGLGMAFSNFVQFAAYALAFYVGALLISRGELDFASLMRIFLAVTMASQAVGSATTWGPDTAKALAATENIFKIIDRPSAIDALAPGGHQPPSGMLGRLEFKGVSFAYPSRPDVRVLKDFSLTIEAGTTVAIVGESGSGKSTLVQLLERFYDPTAGEILVDGLPLPDCNVAWARSHMGLVQQEPALFADSIAYNIAYGVAGEGKQAPGLGVPTDAPEDAAFPLAEALPANPALSRAGRDANAHDFIMSFKHGYATHCGSRGAQLSGGQKQRVAIARAIVRDPSVLLLDEATSALDTASEAVVQSALDRLLSEGGGGGVGGSAKKRTTLVIAHRLSTVRNADLIVVLSAGRILEQGTHASLMAMEGGAYRKLATAQADPGEGGTAGGAHTS